MISGASNLHHIEQDDGLGQQRRELVGFRVGDQAFCIDTTYVLEIRGWTPATPLPHAPEYMLGVVNLRGVVLPIMDLAARLGLPTTQASARHAIIVVKSHGRSFGLLVEGVSDIMQLDDHLRQSPDVGADRHQNLIAGVYPVDGSLVSLLDLDKVLPPESKMK